MDRGQSNLEALSAIVASIVFIYLMFAHIFPVVFGVWDGLAGAQSFDSTAMQTLWDMFPLLLIFAVPLSLAAFVHRRVGP